MPELWLVVMGALPLACAPIAVPQAGQNPAPFATWAPHFEQNAITWPPYPFPITARTVCQQLSLCARRKKENSHINLERGNLTPGNLKPGNLFRVADRWRCAAGTAGIFL